MVYFVNFRCTGLSGPGPWGFSLTSLMDDPALGCKHLWTGHSVDMSTHCNYSPYSRDITGCISVKLLRNKRCNVWNHADVNVTVAEYSKNSTIFTRKKSLELQKVQLMLTVVSPRHQNVREATVFFIHAEFCTAAKITNTHFNERT